MKRIVVLLFSVGVLFSCSNTQENEGAITTDIVTNPATASGDSNSEKVAEIKFNHTDYNFGTVIAGEKVTHTFKFKNVGNKDLLLVKVKPS